MARIGITLGDPAGIGPEIVVKALAKLRKETINLTIIGSVSILTATQMMLKSNFSLPRVIDTDEVEFEFGKVQRSAGRAALDALRKAVNLIKEGEIDALVTAPVNKEAVRLSESGFTGHTGFLAQAFDVPEVLMIAHSPYASFAFVTTHHPLQDVASLITTERVLHKLELYNDFLMALHGRDVGIAVLAFNPHSREFSHGEEEKISQAISLARESGIDAEGPYPADTFHNYLEDVDGFLVQYHDQGMIPAKLLARGQGVNITWGLPFVRTSPLHGSAFDIAGKGEADPSSFIEAIRMADRLTRS